MSLSSIRRQKRRERRALSPGEQREAALSLCRHLAATRLFRRAHRIAFYCPADGEISPEPLLQRALALGKSCYFPVLHPLYPGRLWFVRHQPGSRQRRNRYGILEPDPRLQPRISPWALDLVLVPLVAFDEAGHRLGMGGGYYDRCFAFRRRGIRGPVLLGLAHELQQTPTLSPAPWDINLDALATEAEVYRFRRVVWL